MNALKYLVGTGFYSGLIPKAPGTAGSLAVLMVIFWIIYAQIYPLLIVIFIGSCLISFWVTSYFEEEFGEDPGRMVIDEWAGQSLTFIAISFTGDLESDFIILAAGFILFRFFDILKPLGINKLQKYKGAAGILGDDLLAGLYALLCLKTLIFTWPKLFGLA